jgi:hypothetical protein
MSELLYVLAAVFILPALTFLCMKFGTIGLLEGLRKFQSNHAKDTKKNGNQSTTRST